MSDELRAQIESSLRDWHNIDSEARKRYEAAKEKWDKILQPLIDAIDRSTQLTAEDYAIVINVRA